MRTSAGLRGAGNDGVLPCGPPVNLKFTRSPGEDDPGFCEPRVTTMGDENFGEDRHPVRHVDPECLEAVGGMRVHRFGHHQPTGFEYPQRLLQQLDEFAIGEVLDDLSGEYGTDRSVLLTEKVGEGILMPYLVALAFAALDHRLVSVDSNGGNPGLGQDIKHLASPAPDVDD